MTGAITLPPEEADFAGDSLAWPIRPLYKHSLHFVSDKFRALLPISSQDLIVFFLGFGVALVAINL